MGIIRAAMQSVGSTLADQWLEVIEPNEMDDNTVLVNGVKVRANSSRRGQNTKGNENLVSNGSVIHVYPNQFMMLVDGGKIVDYTAEEGYYTVDNSSEPSLFNGQFGDALKTVFDRVRFGGAAPTAQKVYYVNLQEIKGIKFGTRTPINYFDNFYNSELFLRAHGSYSIKVTNPLLFFREACPRNQDVVKIQDINEQYFNEFMEALQAAINQMSADGIRISYVTSKTRELSKYMASILDEDWEQMRGMQIQSVGIASVSYDEESTKLIHMRNQGAMLSDPGVREGYMQGAVARGIEAAGSNANGAMAGFMGINMAMNAGGGAIGAASAANQYQQQMQQQQFQQQQYQQYQQPQYQQPYQQQPGFQQPQQAAPAPAAPAADSWTCTCGAVNTGKFCSQCGSPKPAPKPASAGEWICQCGTKNTGNFCSNCGGKRPGGLVCDKCGYRPDPNAPIPKFCPECGDPFDEKDRQ